jgi:hypothetical protein
LTLNDVQRAALALFAAREAGEFGSLEQMKAIAYCVRNRVKSGWHDGQWLTVLERSEEAAANMPLPRVVLDPSNRVLQRLIADIDDIYYGLSAGDPNRIKNMIPTAQRFTVDGGTLEQSLQMSCHWCWLNQPITPWFQANILDQQEHHPHRVQMGLMAFFE